MGIRAIQAQTTFHLGHHQPRRNTLICFIENQESI